jgi:hypothetical protein
LVVTKVDMMDSGSVDSTVLYWGILKVAMWAALMDYRKAVPLVEQLVGRLVVDWGDM